MTRQQIRSAILYGWPFFGVAPNGKVLARYIPFGPVFSWEQNHLIPTPLEGDDLIWWMQAVDEDGEDGST